MIYLLQKNATDKYAIKGVSDINRSSLINAVMSDKGILIFDDDSYIPASTTLEFLESEFKVVVNIPAVPSYSSVLNERRADKLVLFTDFLKDTNMSHVKIEQDLDDALENLGDANGDIEDM